MPRDPFAAWMLRQETRALRTRLDRLKSTVLQETMVPAAGLARPAMQAIERFLVAGRRALRARIEAYLDWLERGPGKDAPADQAYRRFTHIKLRFNAVLTQLDIFSEAMSQRSEPQTGVFLSGLDVAAMDALSLPGRFAAPPVVCYLARDAGGAIRRARTRLPGGGENPVALIRLPRERMVGAGIASSLVHEVGHQAAELLELLPGLRAALSGGDCLDRLWARWISEIVADLWAVARIGVASTLGLMSLVSLPRPFVFRTSVADPHPTPWLRVKLSCAMGDRLYPHPQWTRLAETWEAFYPLYGLPLARVAQLRTIEQGIPAFVERLLNHRPASLAGRTLGGALVRPDRTPVRLAAHFAGRRGIEALAPLTPCLAFAALGQGRLDGRISPEDESRMTATLLERWAVRATLALPHTETLLAN